MLQNKQSYRRVGNMNIASLLFSVARQRHRAPAVSGGGVTNAYGEWIGRAARLAGVATAAGAAPGDRLIARLRGPGSARKSRACRDQQR